MNATRMWASAALLISSVAAGGERLIFARVSRNATGTKRERSRVGFSHDLPHLNGDKLAVTVEEVNYGPGESSSPHSHPCPVIGYVVEGTLRTRIAGQPEAIYKAGQSFYEAPNRVHLISANASDKDRAKLLAVFVCDNHMPLSVAIPDKKPEGKK